jgi:hypothetical protein
MSRMAALATAEVVMLGLVPHLGVAMPQWFMADLVSHHGGVVMSRMAALRSRSGHVRPCAAPRRSDHVRPCATHTTEEWSC